MRLTRRLTKQEWQFVGGMAVLIGCACSPARPTPLDFSGEWAGTTSQARPITFTVSPDLKVTRLSVDYAFETCSGNVSVSPNIALTNTTGTAAALVAYTPNGPTGPNRTTVRFLFPSIVSANGSAEFNGFAPCGNTIATWTAIRR
jgi:hypothetical protein